MLHRRGPALAALLLPAMFVSPWRPAAGAMAAPGDVLSGQWQVSHQCLSGCTGTRRFSEIVRRRAGAVYSGTGGEVEVLDKLGSQVLVHAPDNAVVLTIRQPRRLMTGHGVTASGATFSVTWECVGAKPAGGATAGSGLAPRSKAVC